MSVPLSSTLSRYYNAKSLPAGGVDFTVKGVIQEPIKDRNGNAETKVILYFEESPRGLILNKTNIRLLTAFFGELAVDEQTGKILDAAAWAGKKIHVYVDPAAGGAFGAGIRVRKA